jgi:hypothetical protein
MAETPDKRQIYYIPYNYISESRLHVGQTSLRVRYLIDSLILSLILGVVALAIILLFMEGTSVQAKLTVALIICGPGFLLGQIGYNGDPISVAMKNYLAWRKNNRIRIYNVTPRLLGTDPVKAMYEDGSGRDAIVDAFTKVQEKRKQKQREKNLVDGVDFEFEYDPGIDDYLEDNGDYNDQNFKNYDIEIGSGNDLDHVRLFYNSDGYNDDDPEEEYYNPSDFETN